MSRNKGNIFERTAFKAERVTNAKILRSKCAWQVEGKAKGPVWRRVNKKEDRGGEMDCRDMQITAECSFSNFLDNDQKQHISRDKYMCLSY